MSDTPYPERVEQLLTVNSAAVLIAGANAKVIESANRLKAELKKANERNTKLENVVNVARTLRCGDRSDYWRLVEAIEQLDKVTP